MQDILTSLIQIVVLAFTALMMFDFIDGLFPVPPMPKLQDFSESHNHQPQKSPEVPLFQSKVLETAI